MKPESTRSKIPLSNYYEGWIEYKFDRFNITVRGYSANPLHIAYGWFCAIFNHVLN